MKKILSVLLSAVMATSFVNIAMAETEGVQNGDVVLYENNFDNGLSDVANVTTDEFDLTVVTSYMSAKDGGVWRNNDANAQNFKFDFTKGGTQTGLNSGVYKISYDFKVDPNANYTAITGVNMKNHWEGGRALYISKNGYDVLSNLEQWPGAYTAVDGIAHLDMVLDFEKNQRVLYYVNDEFVGEQTNLMSNFNPVTNYSIALATAVSYFDNLKITKIANSTPVVSVDNSYNGNGYIDVAFSNEIIKNAEFYVDDEIMTSVDWLDDFTARVSFENMLSIGNHKLTVKNVNDYIKNTFAEINTDFDVLDGSQKNVLYENNFDNGMSDVVNLTSDEFTLTVNKTSMSAQDGGIWVNDWPNKQNFLFDFTKGGTKIGLQSGTYKISYDFKVNPTGSQSALTGVNMKNNWEGGRAFYINQNGWDLVGYLSDWQGSMTAVEGIASFDMVLDFDKNQKALYYVNGTLVGEHTNLVSNYKPVNNLAIVLANGVSYFDNLKIVKLEEGSFGITAENVYDDSEYVDIKFTKDVLKTAEFSLDGNAVSEENVCWISANTARVKISGLDLGKHTVTVDAKDFLGNSAKFNKADFEIMNSAEKYILYKNDFANGAEDAKSVETDDFILTVQTKEAYKPVTVEMNGNKGVKLADNQKGADYSTFFFDFTKGGNQTGLNTGMYKISYDFAIDNDALYESYSGFNMKNAFQQVWDGGRSIYFSKDGYGIMDSIAGWDKTYVAVDGIAVMDIIIDFNNSNVSYYVNGELKKQHTIYQDFATIKNYSIAMSGCFGYFDNLSITKLENGSFAATGMDAVVGAKALNVYATEPFGEISVSDVNVIGANAVSVSKKTVTDEDINKKYVLEITLDEKVKDGKEYTVTLSENVKNVKAMAVKPSKNSAAAIAKLITIDGNIAELVYMNSTDAIMKPVLIVAAYEADGRLLNVNIVDDYIVDGIEKSEVSSGSVVKINADIDGATKVFAFSGLDTLVPLGNVVNR